MLKKMEIIAAQRHHWDDIWNIFQQVIQSGDTYVFSPETSKEQMVHYWFAENSSAYVALIDGKVAGSYVLRPNFVGLGSHVANCSYMVDTLFRGQKIGKRMGEHSIQEAKRTGYSAMQFNMVVSTNRVAVDLWKSLGFQIVGTSPKAFRHLQLGLVDGYIMHREL